MAITKILYRNGGLRQAIDYITNPAKTNEQLLTDYVRCDPGYAAQQMMDPAFSISRDHGRFYEKQGTLFMATYHPAALLRYPVNKPAVFGDFVNLREKITQVCEHTY